MDELDNILDHLKKSSNGESMNLHTLDEIIPVDMQIKYFQYSKYIQQSKDDSDLERDFLIAQLFSPDVDVDVEDKKYYMCILAGLVDVVAYRALEIYKNSPLELELSDWSAMALIESKMLLDKEFSGEKQLFVSTGLGGKNGLLRFFCIITTADRKDFTDLQKDILSREFSFSFQENKIEIEDLSIQKNYLKILLLSDIKCDIKALVTNVIQECNILGNFIDSHFVLTNIKKFDDAEIEEILAKKNRF